MVNQKPLNQKPQSKTNISKPLFYIIRPSTKIIEFDNVKLPKNLSYKDGVWREFIEIYRTMRPQKKWLPQKRKYFFSVNKL